MKRFWIVLMFVAPGILCAQTPKAPEAEYANTDVMRISQGLPPEKEFLTDHLYVSSSSRHKDLYHVASTKPLLSDFSYATCRVSEFALFRKLKDAYPLWDVFVLTPQYEYKKVFERVICIYPLTIETEDGFYLFINDPVAEQLQSGQFYGALWFVSRTGETRKIREMKKVVPLRNGYLHLLDEDPYALYSIPLNQTYPIPRGKEVFQCGTDGKILLRSRTDSEALFLWDLEKNTLSPWKVDGRIKRFSPPTGGGWITKADGTSTIYSPDFQTFRDVGRINGVFFMALSNPDSLFNQWAFVELEDKMLLLDRLTGQELLSAVKIGREWGSYFKVEDEDGKTRVLDFRELKQGHGTAR